MHDALKSLSFFQNLDPKEFEELLSISAFHTYEKEYILYYEKSHQSELYFLVNGLARAYKIDKYNNETFLYYIYPDSLISEIVSLQEETIESFANVEIIEDAQIVKVDLGRFRELFLKKNRLYDKLSVEILKRTSQMQSLINREFIFDAVEKVAMMLCDDLEMFNKQRRHDISLMLHIQPSTLSRVLNKFKRDGYIEIEKGHVIVKQRDALGRLYEGKVCEKD